MIKQLKHKTAEEVLSLSTPKNIKNADFVFDENEMYSLTKENAEKAAACIKEDKHYKSPSYKEYYENCGKSLKDYFYDEVYGILKRISSANSTRTPNKDICVIAEYILNNRTVFLSRLNRGDVGLVEELAEIEGLKRREFSLASKICEYLSELEFGKAQYVISDSVVRRILPYYLAYYDIPCKKGLSVENISYSELVDLIFELLQKIPEKLDCRELDRILWYCYKNDSVRCAVACSLIAKNADR